MTTRPVTGHPGPHVPSRYCFLQGCTRPECRAKNAEYFRDYRVGLGLGFWARVPLPGPWKAQRACAEETPATFQPTRGDLDGVARAKAICGRCPVAADCLDYALRYPALTGIFGGFSETERRLVRRERMAG